MPSAHRSQPPETRKPGTDAASGRFLETAGATLFRWRDYTAIAPLVLFLALADPQPTLFVVGVALMVAGELIRLSSVRHIGGSCRTRGTKPGAALVQSGPFGRVRNPLYIGNLLLTVGVAALSGRPVLIGVAVLLFVVQYVPVVRWEESRLREQFGEAYVVYTARVRRWSPRWRGPAPENSDPISFRRALHAERRTLSAMGVVVALFLLRAWVMGH